MINTTKRTILFAILSSTINLTAHADETSPTDVIGHWVTHTGDRAAFHTCGDSICGTLEWEYRWEETNSIPNDEKNPDENLRDRPLKGLTILYGFRETKRGWRKGKFYSPWNGKTFNANVRRIDEDTLRLSGCVAPFICQSYKWTRSEIQEPPVDVSAIQSDLDEQ